MTRLAVMAHFDVDGQIAPHVARHVEALAHAVDELVVVSTSTLTPAAQSWFGDRAHLIRRPNFGYDFVSWRSGLEFAGDLKRFDEVVLTNDSFVGPLVGYATIFEDMANEPVDFWGFTQSARIAPHVQSFFLAFRSWVVRSRTFQEFWEQLIPLSDRSQVIRTHEVGLSRTLHEAGFASGSYFVPNASDADAARMRMQWWAAHRSVTGHRRPPREVVEERSQEPWNPAIALADRALEDGRLPYVKIDTLRYDPYGLGGDRLLSKCEAAYPDYFEGVREFLHRTNSRYPRRSGESLSRTPSRRRPLAGLVKY